MPLPMLSKGFSEELFQHGDVKLALPQNRGSFIHADSSSWSYPKAVSQIHATSWCAGLC